MDGRHPMKVEARVSCGPMTALAGMTIRKRLMRIETASNENVLVPERAPVRYDEGLVRDRHPRAVRRRHLEPTWPI
ncbi:hypothetical protein [Rhodanobacter sp. L36]|uniref:hypothetical protein n=1 Tax=Rhodanobacter sp. L36 TaxID=1747221 RepID=UPI00131EB470|nr:hypothetical protein [Rhodanobacter sp. L36]